MKRSKLIRHLKTRHPEYLEKEPLKTGRCIKAIKIRHNRRQHQRSFACIEASYVVSLRNAKSKKPHTIGEDLILP